MDDKIVSSFVPAIEAGRPALSEAEIERRRGRPWTLAVVSAMNIAPRMRRVRLTADNLDAFRPRPGQEIVLQIPQAAGEPARRHYTIRNFDPQTRAIDVDFVLHGDSAAGVRWALDARPGQAIDIRGPRGRIALAAGADWHLFSGDETALPAIFALVEALDDGAAAYVFIEIGDAQDEQVLKSRADARLTYLPRNGAPPGPSRILPDAIERFALPPGRGHAIIIGETGNVRSQRHHLVARGMGKEQIYSEGYWRPGRIGGHDHVEE
ncbi:MAG TPA: siderophore-interacting protein [Stellaceae bacterium]|nr:siderophore-interacting protein [Stellaceae bacterium]